MSGLNDMKCETENLLIDLKNLKDVLYDEGRKEEALALVYAVSSIMYHVNFAYCDEDLEAFVKKCAYDFWGEILCNEVQSNRVVLYDEYGTEYRGLVSIYLKALIENGYDVSYITRVEQKDSISKYIELLSHNKNNEIIYIERNDYEKEAQVVLDVIERVKPASFIVNVYPDGIVAPLVCYALKASKVKSYLINATDHAFWIGTKAYDYIIEFRDYGYNISKYERRIPENKLIKLEASSVCVRNI